MSRTPDNPDYRSIRLFITKPLEELESLPDFCAQNNILLHAHSFLTFEEVPFQAEAAFDVVFFASPRAAYFFLKHIDCSQKLIATAGESTKRFVEKFGLNVHFSPKNSGEVENASVEFARWANGKNILFPVSGISQKSYTKQLQDTQFQVVQVYKTQISTKKIESGDVYVFTSPSNVKGFLESNTIPPAAQVIAWGETTLSALRIHVEPDRLFMLEESSEQSLIDFLPRIFPVISRFK